MSEELVIYADPPWRYEFPAMNNSKRAIEEHYPTMTLEKIKNYQIPQDKNVVLFLWATAPKLREALEVMAAWGFKYRTCAVWDKEWIGTGYWFRNRHELLLVGTRGKIKSPFSKKLAVPSVYRQKRTKHSEKPAYFRNLIDRWFPDAKKIELFARTKGKGWKTEGNEKITSIYDWI